MSLQVRVDDKWYEVSDVGVGPLLDAFSMADGSPAPFNLRNHRSRTQNIHSEVRDHCDECGRKIADMAMSFEYEDVTVCTTCVDLCVTTT